MKLLQLNAENFGSYEKLDINFQNQGLTLIEGATGSGKSTLLDAVSWVLFGRTAKGGAVDEVISWPGDKVTTGSLNIDLGHANLLVYRSRGKGKNDLWYALEVDTPIRGKDTNDTQKMLNSTLNMTYELYLSAAYFHEFSQTAQFFNTTAKHRRALCEQIVNLDFIKKIQVNCGESLKKNKEVTLNFTKNIDVVSGKIQMVQESLERLNAKVNDWIQNQVEDIYLLKTKANSFYKDKKAKIVEITAKMLNFEAKREKQLILYRTILKELNEKLELAHKTSVPCPTCGSLPNHEAGSANDIILDIKKLNMDIDELKDRENIFIKQLEQAENEKNTYADKVLELEKNSNPYEHMLNDEIERCEVLNKKLEDLAFELDQAKQKTNDLEVLELALNDTRGLLITNAIKDLENKTNDILSTYFDAEFKIKFSVEDADKVEVEITKDGNYCVYTQLSKGQRQILKLAFSVSVMEAVANYNYLSINTLFFDESMDGMDDDIKIKALKLLEKLSLNRDSVVLIEHNDNLKAMVTNKYHVELVSGKSEISKP